MPPTRLLLPFMLCGLLGACSAEPARNGESAPVDPATRLALEVPLLIDPGLDTQSRRFAVMSDPAPVDGSLPIDDFAAVTVAVARAEALAMSAARASTALKEAPCPACTAPTLSLRTAAVCKADLVADLAQALEMPKDLPIYPRAHLREAGAGVRAGPGACTVRAASFTAPASPTEALVFYKSTATGSGFAISSARSGATSALVGQRARDGARLAIIVRPVAGRVSEIDLIVSRR